MNGVDETEIDAVSGEEAAADATAGEADGTGAGAASPSDEGAAVVESLEAEIRALQDRLMRQAAEYQNYRRRTEEEKTRMVAFGKAVVVQQLLDVVDDFERSLDAARSVEPAGADAQAFSALREGVELVYTKLRDELARIGVEEIAAVGQPFDEHAHEALMQQPAAEGEEPGMVVGEIQKGYRMGDRVLRHAKVIVSA